jgi:hypothetical protein
MNLRFWQRDDPVLIVPYLRDSDDCTKQDKVKEQCRKCVHQLVSHLFRWEKSFPSHSTLKTWDQEQKRFLGLDLEGFQDYLMSHFSIRTEDGRQWLLDKKLAALIWESAVAADSPLLAANWAEEARRRRA